MSLGLDSYLTVQLKITVPDLTWGYLVFQAFQIRHAHPGNSDCGDETSACVQVA